MPDLVVVPTAGTVASSGWSRRDDALLVLDEGRLVLPDDTALDVGNRGALAEVGRVAQAVSERALAHAAGEGDGVHRSAVKVAAMSKLAVFADVAAFLKTAHTLRHAVDLTAPRRVRWLADRIDLARALRSHVAEGLRFDVAHVQARTEGWRDVAVAALKRSQLDAAVRALSTLPDVRPVRRPTQGTRVLGVFDVRNEGMITNVLAVVRHCADRGDPIAAVYMERRVGTRIRSALGAHEPAPLASFGRPDDLVQAARIAGAVRRAAAAIVVDAGGGDALAGSAARYAASRLRPATVWQALVDLRAIRRSMDVFRPDVILVASDAHRYARGYVLEARETGVSTAVLQHGALAFEHFYVPVVADRMLAWGPWCRDWFMDRGVTTERVQAVGCVRAPPRQPLRGAVGPPQRWLFAAQPVPDVVTHALLDRLHGALRAHPAARLIVRPHPGESRRGALMTMLDAWDGALRARVSVSPVGRSLADDLAASDVCLVSQSTVGIDALVAGVPVVLLTHDRVAEPIPFQAFDAVLVAASVSQVVDAIASLGRPGTVRDLAGGAGAFLDAYLGRSGAEALEAARGVVLARARATRA